MVENLYPGKNYPSRERALLITWSLSKTLSQHPFDLDVATATAYAVINHRKTESIDSSFIVWINMFAQVYVPIITTALQHMYCIPCHYCITMVWKHSWLSATMIKQAGKTTHGSSEQQVSNWQAGRLQRCVMCINACVLTSTSVLMPIDTYMRSNTTA